MFTHCCQPKRHKLSAVDTKKFASRVAKMFEICHFSNVVYPPCSYQLAQLMADLQKMPGGAGLLKKQAGKLKTKERSSVSKQ